jgi:hypothetical protein
MDDAVVELGIANADGDRVVTLTSADRDARPFSLAPGPHRVVAEVEVCLLPGEFMLDVGIHFRDGRTADYVQSVGRFTALNAAETGDDHYPWGNAVRGYVRPRALWELEEAPRMVIP